MPGEEAYPPGERHLRLFYGRLVRLDREIWRWCEVWNQAYDRQDTITMRRVKFHVEMLIDNVERIIDDIATVDSNPNTLTMILAEKLRSRLCLIKICV